MSVLIAPAPCDDTSLGLPPPIVPQGFGVAIHFLQPGPGEMTQFSEAGFGFARMDMSWGDVEKSRGVYDFHQFDVLTDALAAAHCRPMYIIDYYNQMYEGGMAPRTDAGRAAFARFAAAAAAHFRGRGVIWEIWNEPNGLYWAPLPNVDDYSLLAVAVARAIRTADPNACIIAPATSEIPLDFLRTVFSYGLLRFIDGVSIHPYRGKNPETAGPEYLVLHKLIAACTAPGRQPVPIVCSEWGYPSNPNWGNALGQAPPITEDIQGRYILREWLSNLAVGVSLTVWYDWREDGTDPGNPEHAFGTVHQNGKTKPAYTLTKAIIQGLYGYRYSHRLPFITPNDWRLLFCKGNSLAVVSWTTDALASGEAQTPLVRFVAQSDPDYAMLLKVSLVQYGSIPLIATPSTPAQLPVTVVNPGSVPMRATVAVAGVSHTLRIAPGQQQTTTFLLRGDIASADDASVPVQVMLNGEKVIELPRVTLATVGNIDLSVEPTASGRQIHLDALGAPFKGSVRIETDGKTTVVPLNLGAFTSAVIDQDISPSKEIRMTAFDTQDRIVGVMHPKHFLALDFPKSLQDDPRFNVNENVSGSSRTDPARLVPAGAGAPASVAIAMRDQPLGKWLLQPTSDSVIPPNARDLVIWIRANRSFSNVRTQFEDSTGQTFQLTLSWINWKGWRAVHIPLGGVAPPVRFGGANDGILHPPLRWKVVVMTDAFLPNSEPDILIAAPYYEMP